MMNYDKCAATIIDLNLVVENFLGKVIPHHHPYLDQKEQSYELDL